ncbi:MAG: acyl-CoA dehydrogenase, partial [Planctomycetota bacterium]
MAEFYTDRRDVEFTLFEQNDVEKLRSLPAFSEITLEDMKMILEQAEELAKNVIYPLDEVADTVGAQYREGKVVMPEEFHGAYKTLREGGWLSMAHSPEW